MSLAPVMVLPTEELSLVQPDADKLNAATLENALKVKDNGILEEAKV